MIDARSPRGGRRVSKRELKGAPLRQDFRWPRNGYGGNASWRCQGRSEVQSKAGDARLAIASVQNYDCNASILAVKRRGNTALLIRQSFARRGPRTFKRRPQPKVIIGDPDVARR